MDVDIGVIADYKKYNHKECCYLITKSFLYAETVPFTHTS